MGYLERSDARRYHDVLSRIVNDGKIPVMPSRIWARNDDGTWRARVTLALGEPEDLLPANEAPQGPTVELPARRTVQATGEEQFVASLRPYLGRERGAQIYVTLVPGLGTQAKPGT